MSFTFLSFGSIAELYNNSNLAISPIGELSNKARTYAKDPSAYSADETTTTVLYNFLTSDENGESTMSVTFADKQIEVSDWLYDQAKKGNLTDSVGSCLNMLTTQFGGTIEFLEVGEMVTDSTVYMPSMIHGYHLETITDENGESTLKHEFFIWYAEEYFRREYPKVSFAIVHPIPLEDMDSLMEMNYLQVNERLAQETPDIIEDRTDVLTDGDKYPYTSRGVKSFEIMDDVNNASSVGYWRYLTWGNNTDSEDQLYEQIQNEILENSEYDREDWEEKIPDLFNPVEFTVVPSFNDLGIKNLTNATSTYSPVLSEETRRVAVDYYLLPTVGEEHIIKSLETFPMLYKSIKVGFVSKPTNREGFDKITNVIGDYQLIPSTDAAFGDMSPLTRSFIFLIEELLAAAETVTPYSVIPAGIARLERDGKLCVSKRLDSIRLVMITRYQFEQDGLFNPE